MTDKLRLDHLQPANPWATHCTPLNDKPWRADAAYVLCWLQQTLRGHRHAAIEAALHEANARRLPLVVYHGLKASYPHASQRIHRFMLGASARMGRVLRERGIECLQYVERPGNAERGLVHRLASEAAAVFADDQHVFVGHSQPRSFASNADVATYAVDANLLVPARFFSDRLASVRAFRSAHAAVRQRFIEQAAPDASPTVAPASRGWPFAPDRLASLSNSELDQLAQACAVASDLPASTEHVATDEACAERLERLAHVAQNYDRTRNNPALPHGSSQLSPYLHFGLFAVSDVIEATAAAEGRARWKFLDEFLTWREWSHHLALHQPLVECYEGMPLPIREMLQRHAADARPQQADLHDIVHGQTGIVAWDAGQRQWLATGWMHNALRMPWACQLLRLSPSPKHAWALGRHLNDRLSLDGRDPATSMNLTWCFTPGRWDREAPIYGRARQISGAAVRARPGMKAWLTAALEAPVPQIRVPTWDELVADDVVR